MQDVGKLLVVVGLVITVAGLALWSGLGRGWLGHLPGDVHVNRPGFNFHLPIVTCVVISIVLSFLVWLFRR